MEQTFRRGQRPLVPARTEESEERFPMRNYIQTENSGKYSDKKGDYDPRPSSNGARFCGPSSVPLLRPELGTKSHSSPSTFEAFPQLLPIPSSELSRKAMRLAGLDIYDLKVERAFSKSYEQHPETSEFSDSSSVYSRSESGFKEPDKGETYLKSSTYSESESSGDHSDLGIQGKKASHSLRRRALGTNEEYRAGVLLRAGSIDTATLEEFLDREESRYLYVECFGGIKAGGVSAYDQGLTDVDPELLPNPLAIRTKSKKPENLGIENKSLFANARDSMSWGIREITEITPTRSMRSSRMLENRSSPKMSSPIASKKRNFSSSKHPLKSPFPFYSSRKGSNPEELDESRDKLSKRLSGAMRRISGGPKASLTKREVIYNSARVPNGPDTPMPVKSGFMTLLPSVEIGETIHTRNEHFQEAYTKAKESLKIKTSSERRRESMKKKIVVIGITDQSPGELPRPL